VLSAQALASSFVRSEEVRRDPGFAADGAGSDDVPIRSYLAAPILGRGGKVVARAWVDPGPIIKRFQPKDRGKAYPIKKRTSHLVVALDQREE